ncbi:MAG: phage holin family protein, partial [Nitrospirota bacterium]|nr:phage holin family protein [Nitrospirota bacterium]
TYTTLPLWACYGIVGVISAVIGGIFFYSLSKLGSTLRLWPFRTVHSIKEDARWIKEQVLSTKT